MSSKCPESPVAVEPRRRLISICVPTYNEEGNVAALYERVCDVMRGISDRYDFELLFTDNHSEDATFEEIADLARRDSRVRAIRFSRNFGFQRSILANFCRARGDAAIELDCDLQDPPELITRFIEYWEQGYKVVYGIRRNRPKESRWLFQARRLFYRFIDFLSEQDLPKDAGDFRLIDHCIVDELRKVHDQTPYLRGMIAGMGFRQIGIPYDRDVRTRGSSKFSLLKLMSLALDGILQHSIVPLRLATLFGSVTFALSAVAGLYYLLARLFLPTGWPQGFASTTIFILISMSTNALLLGIIGEYIGRIYKNVKQVPMVIIEQAIDSTPHGSDGRNAGSDAIFFHNGRVSGESIDSHRIHEFTSGNGLHEIIKR
jgi:polyisoprenyl-phosphate glycosyltransferase